MALDRPDWLDGSVLLRFWHVDLTTVAGTTASSAHSAWCGCPSRCYAVAAYLIQPYFVVVEVRVVSVGIIVRNEGV